MFGQLLLTYLIILMLSILHFTQNIIYAQPLELIILGSGVIIYSVYGKWVFLLLVNLYCYHYYDGGCIWYN